MELNLFQRRIYLVIFVVTILVSSIASKKLNACHNATVDAKGNFPLTENWFKWGTLYSYCMQYNTLENPGAAFDSECASDNCKKCMRPCGQALPYDLSSCLISCGLSNACSSGCKFYDVLVRNGTPKDYKAQNITVNPSNVPKILNGGFMEKENFNAVAYKWQKISDSTVYLVSIEMKNDMVTAGVEDALFLTSDVSARIDINAICDNLAPLMIWQEKNTFRINVYPINMNGFNRSVVMSSSYRVKEVPAISLQKLKIGAPYHQKNLIGLPSVQWDITPKFDKDITFVFIVVSWKEERCKREFYSKRRSLRQVVRIFKSPGVGQLRIPIFQYPTFENCTAELEITSYTNCLKSSKVLYSNLTYRCEDIKGNTCAPPTPTTTTTSTTTKAPDCPEICPNVNSKTIIFNPLNPNQIILCVNGRAVACFHKKHTKRK